MSKSVILFITTAQVRGVRKNRVDDQRFALVVVAYFEVNLVARQNEFTLNGRVAAIGLFLIQDGLVEPHLPNGGVDQQLALRIEMQPLHSLELQLDCTRICPWRDNKVVFELGLVAVVSQVDARIDARILDARIIWHVTVPLIVIVADQIVGVRGLGSNSSRCGGLVTSHRDHLQRRRLARLNLALLRLYWSIMERKHRIGRSQKERIAIALRQELHTIVGLPHVRLECQRLAQIVLLNPPLPLCRQHRRGSRCTLACCRV